jgi:hypothetical protein
LSNIGLSEFYVMQSCLGRASLRAINRARVTLNCYDLSCRTYEPAQQHRYVSDTSAKIQDALPRANPGFSEEPLRNWGKPSGLPDQALVLRVRATK